MGSVFLGGGVCGVGIERRCKRWRKEDEQLNDQTGWHHQSRGEDEQEHCEGGMKRRTGEGDEL